ncbi:hypothetical protein H6G95_26775 [Nostoc linckia FACHB-391]|uniref:Uncharacterized protein n=1 Tax=Nostoc linckia FACHB-391 TaxID=2692906 RepID=A0ABR8F3Q7_NOSLI|nr:hypothetical protein [Nostoc linckia FACHB-391]
MYRDCDISNLVILKDWYAAIAGKTNRQIYNRKSFDLIVNSFAFLASGFP